MAIEGSGVELCEDVDLVDGAVDTVAHWNIDEPVCPANGHLPRQHDHATSARPCFTYKHISKEKFPELNDPERVSYLPTALKCICLGH